MTIKQKTKIKNRISGGKQDERINLFDVIPAKAGIFLLNYLPDLPNLSDLTKYIKSNKYKVESKKYKVESNGMTDI